MKTFMFPGQGSQSKGMGGALFDEFPELTEKADKVLGYSIRELCLDDPRRELNKTRFTQPALYVVNALLYFKKIEETGNKPDYLAGHSLGEFNALLAAECFDFEAGLKLVKRRAELMSRATDGGMAAILNATKEEIETILEKNDLKNIDLANYNTPSQIVISGSLEEIGKAQSLFQQGAMLYYPLNTSGAFHSRFMQPAKEKFEAYLKKFKFSQPKIPVISNVTAKPYVDSDIVENLSRQISSTVKWSESIQYLLALATDASDTMEFEEIGHGDVLTKLVHTIKQQTPGHATTVAESRMTGELTSKSGENREAVEKIKTEIVPSIESAQQHPEPNPNTVKETAADKVKLWNKVHAIGTSVKSSFVGYEGLETRTEAMVLFGHRAAVYMKGYNGYFDLDEVTPI